MKSTLFLLLASGLLLTACNKSGTGKSSTSSGQEENHSASDLDELMKLPDSAKMLDLWAYPKTPTLSGEAFEVSSPKVSAKRVSKDLFEVRAETAVTAKSDLYSLSVPLPVLEGGKTMAYTVTERLLRKSEKKLRCFQCQVRYGPMNWGRNPEKVQWNWEKPEQTGDDLKIYEPGGASEWASAETLKINAEGTASSNPEILIRGTPDFLKAVEKHPKLATVGVLHR